MAIAGSTTRTCPSRWNGSTCSAPWRSSAGSPASGPSAGTPGAPGPTRAGWWWEEGGFLYDADDYNDDLPFWTVVAGRPHLVVPYTLDANDMRFVTPQGFNSGDQFFTHTCVTRSTSCTRREPHTPRMMSIGLHCRLVGRPGRFAALQRFVDHVLAHDAVWCCRRIDIARHWRAHHPHREARSWLRRRTAAGRRPVRL